MRRRRLAPLGLAAVSVLAVAGCGVSTNAEIIRGDQQAVDARQVRAKQDAAAVASRRASLPARAGDELAISVRRSGVLTDFAVSSLHDDGSPTTYQVRTEPTDNGFADLCAGRIDLLQSGRRITDSELAQCEANGLQVDRPIVLGYATAVLVTQNGHDIGGDCLTLGAVRSLLSVGSTVSNWRQIGFSNTPFSVAAQPVTSPAVLTVGTIALRRPIGTTVRANFRTDLQTFSDPNDLSNWVINQDRLDALDTSTSAYEQKLSDARRDSSARAVRRAEAAAAAKVVKQIDAENRRRMAAKTSVADPAALQARNAKRVSDAKRTARIAAQRTERTAIARAGATYRAQRVTAATAGGRLGIVSYPFYEAHSDVLRPLEIDPRTKASGTSKPSCRFPSQQTIVNGSYPLTLPIYLYGDERTMEGTAARALISRLLERNASLARHQDVTGLSAASIVSYRQRFGLSSSTTSKSASGSGTATSTSTTTTPAPAQGGIPGINSQDVP